jgi:DNA repair protein RadC
MGQMGGGVQPNKPAWVGAPRRPVPVLSALSHMEGAAMHKMTVKTVEVRWDGSDPGERLDEPAIAAQFLTHWLATMDSDQEHFGMLALDARHRLLGLKVLTSGTHTQAPVDGAKLYRAALAMEAQGVLIFHNHPNGSLDPSRDDLDLTRRLVIGGKMIGVTVHDHIIIGLGRWLSVRSARPEIFSGGAS